MKQFFHNTAVRLGVKRGLQFLLAGASAILVSCTGSTPQREVLVSVRDQKVALMEQGKPVKVYPCSTSKFGVGDRPGTCTTPLGKLQIAKKIGAGQPAGMVFKCRQPTGEVLRPNAPGRDPIVTRIMWLSGTESTNRLAYNRYIYIHGTPEESNIGRPASYGCVRMRSCDVMDLYDHVTVGTQVRIMPSDMPHSVDTLAAAQTKTAPSPAPVLPVSAPAPAPAHLATSPAPASAQPAPVQKTARTREKKVTFGPPLVTASLTRNSHPAAN